MEELFRYLCNIEDKYVRTIFNFHLLSCSEIGDVYGIMKTKIANENLFSKIVTDTSIQSLLKKIVYCDIQLTKHIINQNVYPEYTNNTTVPLFQKMDQYFDINNKDDDISIRTLNIFKRDKSSLVSYIKTTNKKRKVDYGEIKKAIHSSSESQTYYFSGSKGDDYIHTTIKSDLSQPWIKTMSKRMRIDIENDTIITRGKSSILQTIEIIFKDRTCVKIFKDSTMHIILSKDKTEDGCIGIIDKMFHVYKTLFSLLFKITNNVIFAKSIVTSTNIISQNNIEAKLNIIREMQQEYFINNFRIGMFNLMYKPFIDFTIFPSLLDNYSKIKIFKGKKLNIVALQSCKDCINYIVNVEYIMELMRKRSNILHEINIETTGVSKLKELLLLV
ncbi:intermediate transcription factor VITF-3 [Cetacean poxvirus 1]|nr:intermediate transcription factor VITF-3 [Cetacean poxvirus 1]